MGAQDAPFTPYNLRVPNTKGTQPMPTTKVYAVIGGSDYEGEDFKSLRLFDCFSTATEYLQHLEQNYDYSLLDTREVMVESALVCAT